MAASADVPRTRVPATSAAINLQRLVVLRTIAIGGQALAIWSAILWLNLPLPLPTLSGILLAALACNVFTWARLRHARPVHDIELFAHLVFDVLALTAVLYVTGGSTNPFAPLYLLPLTLTAAALPSRYTWAMMLFTVACYSLLVFFYVPLPHNGAGHDFQLHVLGMWLGFLLSAVLIAYFVVRMRETLHDRDRLRAQMREQELRHERLIALGTLAAGAAHELGTPLATMAVLANDLTRDSTELPEKLQLLREQVERCKNILASLSVSAGQPRAEGGGAQALDEYFERVLARFRAQRPDVNVERHVLAEGPAPCVVTDQTLTQALLNILNNAADVSSDVAVTLAWTSTDLHVTVRDRGPGFSVVAEEHAGEPFFSTKAPGEGMGLGLFLARSAVERLNGLLTLANAEDGGAICGVRLPLDPLRVHPDDHQPR